MVKINNILSLLAVSSFFALVSGKPFENSNQLHRRYETKYCNDLAAYLETKDAKLTLCITPSDDFSSYSINIESDSINQDIIDKVNTFDVILDYVAFENVTKIQKKLDLGSLKAKELYFDNKHLPYTGEKQEILIPNNVLKTAKNLTSLSIIGFDVSQENINEITTLTNLTRLMIDGCDIDRNTDFTKLKNLKNLDSLILSTLFIKDESIKYLNQFPESICQLKKLNYLSLYRNNLTKLPKCIKNLKNLEELNVELNELTSLPKEIGNLSNLKVVKLNDNDLGSLPVEFGKLTKLEQLSMLSNKISTLPDEFGNLTNLKKLDISYNLIGSIPAAIGKLSKLEDLNLSDNKIYRIPSTITKLSNLKALNLNHNKIKVIPDAIKKLKNLEDLYLVGNLITEIPEAIVELKKLTILNLIDNNVNEDDIPETIKKNLPNLEILVKRDY